jgi:hypothetical protein
MPIREPQEVSASMIRNAASAIGITVLLLSFPLSSQERTVMTPQYSLELIGNCKGENQCLAERERDDILTAYPLAAGVKVLRASKSSYFADLSTIQNLYWSDADLQIHFGFNWSAPFEAFSRAFQINGFSLENPASFFSRPQDWKLPELERRYSGSAQTDRSFADGLSLDKTWYLFRAKDDTAIVAVLSTESRILKVTRYQDWSVEIIRPITTNKTGPPMNIVPRPIEGGHSLGWLSSADDASKSGTVINPQDFFRLTWGSAFGEWKRRFEKGTYRYSPDNGWWADDGRKYYLVLPFGLGYPQSMRKPKLNVFEYEQNRLVGIYHYDDEWEETYYHSPSSPACSLALAPLLEKGAPSVISKGPVPYGESRTLLWVTRYAEHAEIYGVTKRGLNVTGESSGNFQVGPFQENRTITAVVYGIGDLKAECSFKIVVGSAPPPPHWWEVESNQVTLAKAGLILFLAGLWVASAIGKERDERRSREDKRRLEKERREQEKIARSAEITRRQMAEEQEVGEALTRIDILLDAGDFKRARDYLETLRKAHPRFGKTISEASERITARSIAVGREERLRPLKKTMTRLASELDQFGGNKSEEK